MDHFESYLATKTLPESRRYTLVASILRRNLQISIQKQLSQNQLTTQMCKDISLAIGMVAKQASKITKTSETYDQQKYEIKKLVTFLKSKKDKTSFRT